MKVLHMIECKLKS